MTEKRFTLVYQGEDAWEHEWSIKDNQEKGDWVIIQGNGKEIVEIMNTLHEENMNNRAEITRFKLIVSDIVDDLEKQAKSEEPIVISMDYVDWIKSELDLKLNGLKR